MSAKVSGRRIGFSKSNRPSLKAQAALLAAGLLALQGGRAFATNYTWIGATGGAINTGSNWTPTGGPPSGGSDVAMFNGNTSGNLVLGLTGSVGANPGFAIVMTSGQTSNVDIEGTGTGVNMRPGSMTMNSGSGALTIGATGQTYWVIGSGANPVFTNNSSNPFTMGNDSFVGFGGGTQEIVTLAGTGNFNWGAEQGTASGNNAYQAFNMSGSGTLTFTNPVWSQYGNVITALNLQSGLTAMATNAQVDATTINLANLTNASTAVMNTATGSNVVCTTLNIGGQNGGTGTLNINGGNFQVGSGGLTTAPNGSLGFPPSPETINIGSGALQIQSNSNVNISGYYGHPLNVNQTGGLLAFYSDAGNTLGGTGVWNISGGTDTYNLSGGTFSTPGMVFLGGGGGHGGATQILNMSGGTLQITASGNFVQNFNYSGTGAVASNSNGSVGTLTINVGSGGGTIDTHGNSVTMNVPFLHSGTGTDGGITVNDSISSLGNLTLSGSNTYTGPTTVTRGMLIVPAGVTIASSNAINIGSGGNFNISAVSPWTMTSAQPISGIGTITGSVIASSGTITAGLGGVGGILNITGSLTLSGAGTAFVLSPSSPGNNGEINAIGGLNVSTSTTVDAIFATLPISSQTFTLFNYSGSAISPSNLTLSLAGSAAGYNMSNFALNYATPDEVNLVFTPSGGASQNLIWASHSSTVWDVGSTANWTNGSSGSVANSQFHNGDSVLFDDTSGVTTNISLNVSAAPGSVTDTANTNNFNISGSGKITGLTSLTMSGSGTLTLGTANDFSGSTALNNGTIVAVNTAGSATGTTGVTIASGATLRIGDNATTGAGIVTGTITDNGSLVINRPDAYTLNSNVSGSGSLTQAGSGTTILSVQPGYSGATTISAGTIQYGVTNALPYYTNLTLSGTGTLNINNLGQTLNNQVTASTGTNINLGTGNISLNTTSPDILQGTITGTTASSVYLNGSTNATLSGNVSTGAVLLQGSSVGTLSGNASTATVTMVGTSALTISGTVTTTGAIALANNNTDNVTLNILPGANISAGTLNVANTGATATGGTGVINQTGGLITAGTVTLANQGGVANSANAIYNLSGGTFSITNGASGLTTAASQYTKAIINISGSGAINLLNGATWTVGNFYGMPTIVNQSGGTVSLTGTFNGSAGGIQINGESADVYNLSGGTLSVPKFTWGGQALNNSYAPGANPILFFNGGILQTNAPSTGLFPADVFVTTNGTQNAGGVSGASAHFSTVVSAGGAIVDTDGNAVTLTNNMSHDTTNLGSTPDGGLTLNDSASTPGVLTLAASNSYTGPTIITRGTLALVTGGSINASPTIYVGSAGNFNVSGFAGYSPAATQILQGVGTVTGLSTLTNGTIMGGNGSAGALTFNTPLTLAGGTSLFDLGATNSVPHGLLVASSGLNVSGGSAIDAAFTVVPSSTQTYVLYNYSGTALSSAAQGLLTVSAAGSVSGVTAHNLSLSFTTGTTDQVLLTFTPGSGVAANLTWASTSSGAWDTSSSNWHNPSVGGSGANSTYFNGDNVTFDDTNLSEQKSIVLNIAATPGSVTISSNTNNFSFSGTGGISGSTGLNKTGTSTLTLGTNNGYSGATSLGGGLTIALNPSGYATGITSTTISGGATFNIGNGSTTGAGNATGAITNNGTLNLDRPDNFTFPAAVSGNAFNVLGAGVATLTGQSTYSGDTLIQAGGLAMGVSNALPSGTNLNMSAGTSFAVGSFTQTIGDLIGPASASLNLGSGQLTVSGNDTTTFAGPITNNGSGGSLLVTNGGTLTLSNNVSAGTLSVSPGDNDTATLNITGGNATLNIINVSDGGTTGGTGTINQSGGSIAAGNVNLANTSSIPGNAVATYDLANGTLNVSTGILMSNSTGTQSYLNIGPGGTLNMLGNSSIVLGNYYGEPATIDQTGGLVKFANGSTGGLQVNGGGYYSWTLSGGELSIPKITWGGQASNYQYANANCTFTFDGGTLQITSSGQFFPGATGANSAMWSADITGNGAFVDTDGNSVLFTVPLASVASPDGGLTKLGAGTLTLSGADTYNGGTNVSVGTLAIANSNAYAPGSPLNVSSGASFVMTNHGNSGPESVAVLGGLINKGTVDVANNALDIQNSSISAVTTQVKAAYSSGTWAGTSAAGVITSSAAAGNTAHMTAVGIMINDSNANTTGTLAGTPIYSTFEGATSGDGDVLVKYTYYGDANLSGTVDGSDYSLIDNGSLSHLTGWYNGDFNYDGVINGSDYTLIDNAFNTQGPNISAEIASPTAQIAGGSAASAVPEPTTLGLLGIAAVGLLGRRRRAGR